jgi:hypothetical protein
MRVSLKISIIFFILVSFFACSDEPLQNTEDELNETTTTETRYTVDPVGHNFILGTQQVGMADVLNISNKAGTFLTRSENLGTNIYKMSLSGDAASKYNLRAKGPSDTTLTNFVTARPEINTIINHSKFKYYFFWTTTHTVAQWGDGITRLDSVRIYKEMYNFVTYLFNTYGTKSKHIFIGNWEGDWEMAGSSTGEPVASAEKTGLYKRFMKIRSAAVLAARNSNGNASKNLKVYFYIEANKVFRDWAGTRCVSKDILPYVETDFISYSSYEAINRANYNGVRAALDSTINKMGGRQKKYSGAYGMATSTKKRVFIGEYGFQRGVISDAAINAQTLKYKRVMKAAIDLNLHFALHWQMFNNVYINSVPQNMGLFADDGVTKLPIWTVLNDYYYNMNNWFGTQTKTDAAVRTQALTYFSNVN